MFQKYQSLPKTVEAVQFTAENKKEVFKSLTVASALDLETDAPIIKVLTIHEDMTVIRLGDWIIKESVPGRYYPIKDDIFPLMYKKRSRRR